jgi:hypothetical protein
MIFARTNGGSRFELNIRQMILAEIPVPLCLVERIRASGQFEHLCLRVKRNKSGSDQRFADLADLGRLSCLHICKRKVWGFIPQTPRLFRCVAWQSGGQIVQHLSHADPPPQTGRSDADSKPLLALVYRSVFAGTVCGSWSIRNP